jgi:hypothetical protein
MPDRLPTVYDPLPAASPIWIDPETHTYPFLALARRLGVDYADVLNVADIFDNTHKNSVIPWKVDSWNALSPSSRAMVEAVCKAKWRWKYPPSRRGDPDFGSGLSSRG